jgi:hypothetical protein
MADCFVFDPPVDWYLVSSWFVDRMKSESLHATVKIKKLNKGFRKINHSMD